MVPFLSIPPFSQTPHLPAFVFSPFHQGESLGVGDSGSAAKGCSRAYVPDSGVLQPHVRSDQGVWWLETNFRFVHLQQLRGEDPFQDGDHPIGATFCRSQRLDGHSGSEGRLPSGSDTSCELQVSAVRGRGQGLAVSGLMFRPHHSASSINPGNGSCVVSPSPVRSEDFTLPRRLASPCSFLQGGSLGEGLFSPVMQGLRNHSEPRKIIPTSISSSVVPRGQDRLSGLCRLLRG